VKEVVNPDGGELLADIGYDDNKSIGGNVSKKLHSACFSK